MIYSKFLFVSIAFLSTEKNLDLQAARCLPHRAKIRAFRWRHRETAAERKEFKEGGRLLARKQLLPSTLLLLHLPLPCSHSPQGRLILELFEGKQDDLELSQLSSSIPSPLRDFLTRCLCRSDPDRWTTEQLLAHAFIQDPLPQLLLAPSNSRRGVVSGSVATEPEEEEEEDEVEEGEDTVPRTADASGESKLKRDFEAFEQLGKGGFGSVIKVGQKLIVSLGYPISFLSSSLCCTACYCIFLNQ